MMLDEAIAEYCVGERLQPNSDKTAIRHLSIARILDQLGKLDEAIAEDRIAVRIKPDLKDAKNNPGLEDDQETRPQRRRTRGAR